MKLPKQLRLVWPAAIAAIVLLGILQVAKESVPKTMAVGYKLAGRAPDCPWSNILSVQRDIDEKGRRMNAARSALAVTEYDEGLGIERITGPSRSFWIKRDGSRLDGRELLADLLAEHQILAERDPQKHVRAGDIVLDCGAHVGVFTAKALEQGAAKVISIEPEPTNVECLRRNFAAEIAAGRVIVLPKGVWNEEKTLTLYEGVDNSGMNHVVKAGLGPSGRGIEIPVTTIDNLVGALQLDRVDFIKMDIEGAEREALTGAADTLRRFRPRMMIDTYHRRGDMEVLPRIIRQAHADYAITCGPCQYGRGQFLPHVVFWQ
jgi:FkbM family methyltransferase